MMPHETKLTKDAVAAKQFGAYIIDNPRFIPPPDQLKIDVSNLPSEDSIDSFSTTGKPYGKYGNALPLLQGFPRHICRRVAGLSLITNLRDVEYSAELE